MIRRTGLKPPSPTALLRWYDAHARDMPWRVKGGKRPNPYHELLSEFMLQQTQVATVIPYFHAFTKRWPTLMALADASLEDVRHAWSGLGYYRRAKFLHECAKAVVARHAGKIPQDEEILRTLPGIGPYTAAAIAAIAFDKKAVVMDGNVERVMARVFAVEEKLPAAKKKLHALATQCLPETRFGDYAQAVMELGAMICTPKNPHCMKCPWKKNCAAFAKNMAQHYPRKAAKQKTPQKYATAFIAVNKKGEVLLRKRDETGMLGGLWEFPSTPWDATKPSAAALKRHAPVKVRWQIGKKAVSHVFSHFKLETALRIGHSAAAFSADNINSGEYRWMKWKDLSTLALPTLTLRIADAAKEYLEAKT
ncbi:MAG: A/G-specific adenine glycosylase [Alphaproteobacteria bacterium]|nr:A/G-specific adenine glycosylase [Alphaproteobacteria bacterium]